MTAFEKYEKHLANTDAMYQRIKDKSYKRPVRWFAAFYFLGRLPRTIQLMTRANKEVGLDATKAVMAKYGVYPNGCPVKPEEK